ncbi:putative insulin-like growth factor 2 antisense gene protein [Passer domesticus]|uniref:putative insulin-like growth factor 2 antisense gene protein n=1 Tax=Passer domesticus TaxID=48849 RepID=UPI0030FE9D97
MGAHRALCSSRAGTLPRPRDPGRAAPPAASPGPEPPATAARPLAAGGRCKAAGDWQRRGPRCKAAGDWRAGGPMRALPGFVHARPFNNGRGARRRVMAAEPRGRRAALGCPGLRPAASPAAAATSAPPSPGRTPRREGAA